MRAQPRHPGVVQPRVAQRRRPARPGRPSSERRERRRHQIGPLALAQVVAGRLAGLRRVAEDARARRRAAGTPRPAAGRTPSRPPDSSGRAPASAAPSSSGRSTVYFADLYRATLPARSSDVSPVAWVSTSRYCPTVTSVRISSKTGRARASSARPHAASVQQLVRPDQRQVAEQHRGAVAERRPRRRASPRRRAGLRTGGAPTARRAGCPTGPSGRRGSARWPAPAPAPPPPRRPARSRRRRHRGSPSRRTPGRSRLPPPSTNSSSASATSASAGSIASSRARWAARNAARALSTRGRRPARSSGEIVTRHDASRGRAASAIATVSR